VADIFGYFNPCNSKSFLKIRDEFTKYYCSTCKALQYNYGRRAKTLLSYDISLLAMFLGLNTSCAKIPPILPCPYCGKFENVKNSNEWKAIATLNLLLCAEKFRDDVHDENSLISKIALSLYKKPINCATGNFPHMANEITEGYERIVNLEKQNADAITIAKAFSEMMYSAMSIYFKISEQQKKLIFAISSWIYIIDAIDDYDKDKKRNRFNPFLIEEMSYKHYINLHRESINETINNILVGCLTHDDDNFDYYSADVLLNEFMPDVSQSIINGVSLKNVRAKNIWHFKCCRFYPQGRSNN